MAEKDRAASAANWLLSTAFEIAAYGLALSLIRRTEPGDLFGIAPPAIDVMENTLDDLCDRPERFGKDSTIVGRLSALDAAAIGSKPLLPTFLKQKPSPASWRSSKMGRRKDTTFAAITRL